MKLWLVFVLAIAGLAVEGCQVVAPQRSVIAARQTRPIDDKLFKAIHKKDAKAVKQLLDKGASPDAIEANDWPAIVEAAGESLEIVKLLLAKGAKINAQQPSQGWTPLTQAITSHQSDVVLYLLEQGADPELPMSDGSTPLHMAVRFGNTTAVEALLKAKINVNARSKEDPNTVHGREEDERVATVWEPGYRVSGRTPLFELATQWQEHPEIATLLLKAGADPKAVDDNGWTPLHEAAKWGSVRGVEDLLKLGVDPNARSHQDFTPLHVAMRSGFGVPLAPIIKKLLAAGADPKALNKQGQTPEDLLRSDAARLLSSTNLSPGANAGTGMSAVLRALNDGLQALHPGADPIDFPKAPVVDGWNVYAPLKMGSQSDESPGQIERKVKFNSAQTQLALTYRPGKDDPPAITLDDVELNAYEPLGKMPVVLQADKELVVLFPVKAGQLGGATWVKFSYHAENGSGSGELGESSLTPNPCIVQHDTPQGREFAISCYDIGRPLQFRIDTLTADAKELKAYRGKVILIQPSSSELGKPSNSTPLLTLKKGAKAFPKLTVRYSYRLVGNKKWRTGNMVL
jgi:hypothetical protein